MKKKKILLYNWAQFDDKEGGGVTVYCNNIVKYMINDENLDVYFLSSGNRYDLLSNRVKVKKTKNKNGDRVKTYAIYNSPIMYAIPQFERIDIYNNDTKTLDVFEKFLEKYGEFDVIHFNNLEGISIEVLKLKEKYPNTKFIYSMHNYFPMCPNVFLWKHDKENCKNYNDGIDCCNCINSNYQATKKEYRQLKYRNNILLKIYRKICRTIRKNNNIEKYKAKEINPNNYKIFREKCIKYINKYIDQVLCVSKRVKEIAVEYGINKEKCSVMYIGTEVANNIKRPKKYDSKNKLNLIYMGYMNKQKGFGFFIEALKHLDAEIKKKINIYIVCRKSSEYDILEIEENLRKEFNEVNYIPGYTHENFNEILKNINLAVIPVLWEDNLPQIAIELTANGVALLTSNLGGANELCNNKEFCFKGNDIEDFKLKLTNIVNGKTKVEDYWKNYNKPKKMKEHMKELYDSYAI